MADEDGVTPRVMVPSAREVDDGLAAHAFTPMPLPPPQPRLDVKARLADAREQLNPTSIAGGNPTLPLLLVGLSGLFTHWDEAAFSVLLPEMRDEFGFDLGLLVALGTIVAAVTLLLTPLIGYLADRFVRVRMLAVGNVVQNAGSVAAAFAPNLGALNAARGLGGLGLALSTPVEVPLLCDWYPPETRARLVTFISVCLRTGGLVAPLVAGGLGALFGWRWAVGSLGALATIISLGFFVLKEPVRGKFDRKAMGASDEDAAKEQAAVSWAEGWRAASSITTLRRIWYAIPFLLAGTLIQAILLSVYYDEVFNVGPFGRGVISAIGGVAGLAALPFVGPLADRALANKPGRIFVFVSGLMLLSAGGFVVQGVSPFLWLSVLAGLPLAVATAVNLPLMLTMMSLVVPARLRAQGIATAAPWQLLGLVLINVLIQLTDFSNIRASVVILVPVNIIGALLIGSAGGGVERDIRAARAASMADEEARRARREGANKMVICRDVDVTYDGAQVLFNVDFDVEEGELVALLGTNGAGKSTLLRAIAGIQEASNGAIFLDGVDITHKPTHQNARGGIVFMPGGKAVFPSLTVAENLRTAAWMYRQDEGYVGTRTQEVLDFFPILRERLDQPAGTMSGGEQQMLALGQAFLMKPRLLMIDELSLGLAPAVVERLLDIVRDINAQGTTVILVEQSANVALTIARRAVFMEKGEIRFDGPLDELLGRGDLLRSVFLGGVGGGAGGAFIASSSGLRRPAIDQEPEQVLLAEDLHLSYGGQKALDGAHVEVMGGKIVGIIGPNGAGKTTLFDVISGYSIPEQGRVVIAGTEANELAPDARARLGLSRSFQNARLFPSLTTTENISVALEQRLASRSALASATWMPAARKSERRAARRVEYLIDLLNLDAFADKFVSELSTGSRRLVDIACVMAAEPRLLLLDEPSSGLAQSEVEVLGPVIRRLAKDTGCGVLVIEHDMPLITALSDHLIAMELGRVLLEGEPAQVVADPRVVQSYLGTSATAMRSGTFLAAAVAQMTGSP